MLVQILRQLIQLRAVVRENLHRFFMLLFHQLHHLTVDFRLGFSRADNSPLPDDPGIRFAIDTANERESVVLLMVRAELHEEIHYKAAQHGVFTLPKPTSKSTMVTAVSWLSSAREGLRKNRKKALTLEEKMEEIRIVNRAKWLLIGELKLEESEAHRYIEKQAMDRCVTKREVAEEIIKTYS